MSFPSGRIRGFPGSARVDILAGAGAGAVFFPDTPFSEWQQVKSNRQEKKSRVIRIIMV